MRHKMFLVCWLTSVVVPCLGGAPAFAAVKPHALIAEGMVLQQGRKVQIWGTADDGEKVTVSFRGQEVSATATQGKWLVTLEPMQAGGPYEMTIAGSNTLHFNSVLVGEVWICSGQSNMEWPVSSSADSEKTVAESNYPSIHLFTVTKTPASAPRDTLQGKWQSCGPETVGRFSAVGYFFGRDLHKALQVPVGLIHTSWGGTPAEAWTSLPALEAEPRLRYLAERQVQALAQFPQAIDRHIADLTRYKQEISAIDGTQRDLPVPPAAPTNPARNPWGAATLYNGMIASVIPYGIRGAIWYQGESNASRAHEYRTLLPTMIKNWRTDWKQGDFPFLIVQLAPFTKILPEPGDSEWAELRDAQLQTTRTLPNTAQAVITDVGQETDIHPRWKEPVGARLALAARALGYGEKIEYSGPAYESMRIEGDKAILTFQHVGGGLVAKNGPLVGFTIAGADRKFVKADAEIHGDQVVVRSPKVEQPVAVRFGWANYPVVNLWNQAGLPASPFRTDEFPLVTEGRKSTR